MSISLVLKMLRGLRKNKFSFKNIAVKSSSYFTMSTLSIFSFKDVKFNKSFKYITNNKCMGNPITKSCSCMSSILSSAGLELSWKNALNFLGHWMY
jgi:hypothetical protein